MADKSEPREGVWMEAMLSRNVTVRVIVRINPGHDLTTKELDILIRRLQVDRDILAEAESAQ